MMKQIPLNSKKFKKIIGYALVDDSDFEWLSQWKWSAAPHHKTVYAFRTERVDGVRKTIYMHRLILGLLPGQQADHKNNNGLDNRRENLRLADQAGNSANRRGWSKSGLLGVYEENGRYRAQVKENGKTKTLGTFDDPGEAALVFDRHKRQIYGEFAQCNFSEA